MGDKDKARARDHAYYLRHRERILKQKHDYHENKGEESKARERLVKQVWREKNRNKLRKSQRSWYEKNKDKVCRRERARRAKNADIIRQRDRERYRKKKLRRTRWRFCAWCMQPFVPSRSDKLTCGRRCNVARKNNTDRTRARKRKWAKAHYDRSRSREWEKRNPEKVKARRRKLYHANPEKFRNERRKAYWTDPDKYRERARLWALKNPEKRRENQLNQYLRQRELFHLQFQTSVLERMHNE